MDDSKLPQVYVDLRINRRLGVLPPIAQSCIQAIKFSIFGASCAATMWWTFQPSLDVTLSLRIAVIIGVAWMIWDRILAPTRYGYTHILVTTKGILFGLVDLYLLWEDVESYEIEASRLRVTPRAGQGPKGWSAPRVLDIPLSKKNRKVLEELFRDNVDSRNGSAS